MILEGLQVVLCIIHSSIYSNTTGAKNGELRYSYIKIEIILLKYIINIHEIQN